MKKTVAAGSTDYLQSMRLWTNFFAEPGVEIAAIARVAAVRDKDVLEVGCGNGRLSLQLSRQARAVIGIDTDERLIEFAGQYAQANRVSNLQFKEGKANKLDLEPESFDIVVMAWMLHMIKDDMQRREALHQAKEVLRPGGHLVIFGLWGDCDYDRIARHFVSRREQEIDPVECYERPLRHVFSSFQYEELPHDSSFSFLFPDCGVALEAFVFAFQNWYGKTLNPSEVDFLRETLSSYAVGSHIELKTQGAVYSAVKP